ncbi:hypothetical protein XELAEV_18034138mg [Xenopus laevis]|uniref:Uncharacterized protein n=1 Tax=Xenopus laevis TaxID=8355 RepID=A0A974CL90_XENLA|nr:hypothetical protein XELAEV_18034138mg [Xenopus laevis]
MTPAKEFLFSKQCRESSLLKTTASAQIATGGIINPVHSHRVPVEVAYKCGFFDKEMNKILSDSTDETKGFFDPNTHENLTYMQLLQRFVQDPKTQGCLCWGSTQNMQI